MTSAQITHILSTKGYAVNKWQTLEKFNRIGLAGDANYFMNPLSNQFYFDTTNNLLYVRITVDSTRRRISGPTDTLYDGESAIPLEGKYYAVKIMYNGYDDPAVGRVHDIVCFDNITGIF